MQILRTTFLSKPVTYQVHITDNIVLVALCRPIINKAIGDGQVETVKNISVQETSRVM